MTEHRCRLFFELVRWALNHRLLDDHAALTKWMNFHDFSDEAGVLRAFRRLSEEQKSELNRAISNGQVESKLWLTSTLRDVLPAGRYNFCVVGAWFGILGRLMAWQNQQLVRRLALIDHDQLSTETMNHLLLDLRQKRQVEVIKADANNFAYRHDFHVIINLATEHFASRDWYERILSGRIIAMQGTNDRSEDDHVACVDSVTELRERYPLQVVMYHGVQVTPKGKRYMVIGRK